MAYYKKIIEKHPKSTYAKRMPYKIACLYKRQKNYEQAEYWYMKQRELYGCPDYGSSATYSLAMLYKNNLNDYVKAVEVLENYKKWYPSGSRKESVLYQLAVCYEKLGKKEEALAFINDALENCSDVICVEGYNELLDKIQAGAKQ